MTPNVIDIYHGDTINNFAALKAAGVLGVIHKASQGANIADPAYVARRQAALAAGLLWGAYTFNTGQDVQSQVDEFFNHALPDANTLMALDFEDNPSSQMSIDQAIQFLKIADLKLGRKLVLYSGNRVKDILGNHADAFLGSHRLWLPQYGPAPHAQASWVTPWLWQYSETGRLPGTAGNLDLNLYWCPSRSEEEITVNPAANLAAEWSGVPPIAAPAPSLLSKIESEL